MENTIRKTEAAGQQVPESFIEVVREAAILEPQQQREAAIYIQGYIAAVSRGGRDKAAI